VLRIEVLRKIPGAMRKDVTNGENYITGLP
jgi:hypothetical protein